MEAPESPLAQRVTVLSKTVAPGFTPRSEGGLSIIVSMGRGVRDMDGFDICCDFADAIGAEIGASRGCVDMKLLGRKLELNFGKFEIKTVYLPDDPAADVREMLLTELED